MSAQPAAILRVRRPELREAVLERVVGAVAARVDLPVDRLSDAQLLASAIAGSRQGSPEGLLEVAFTVGESSFGMGVGPLPRGAAERLLEDAAVPGVGAVVERLADGWSVASVEGARERLDLVVGAAGRATA